MQVAELVAPREFRMAQMETRDPGPGEIQVRVNAVGLCGSDLHAYGEGAIGDTPNQYPMVLGHEPAGTVVQVGPGVTGWSAGDHAALEPALYCYHCEFCRSGHHNVCANIRFLSNPGVPGFFREFVNLPATNVLPIPKTLAFPTATLHEPLAIALHSLKLAKVELGETVAVFGAGPIGLVTVASLKLAGAARIWVVEPLAHRREMAVRMGATVAVDPAETESARQIMAETNGRGVDCVFDCAAKEDTINQGIRAACNGGRVLLTGIHSATHVPIEVSPMRRKELAIINVRRSNHDSEAALHVLLEHAGLFAGMVTHTRPLDQITEAFAINESYADGVGKMVVQPA